MRWIDAEALGSHPNLAGMSDTLIEEQLTESVIGGFYEVYNALGYGFLETVYVAALERELRARGHAGGPRGMGARSLQGRGDLQTAHRHDRG